MTSQELSAEELGELALAAFREAVARVMEDHRRRGKPIAIWKDGRVVLKIPDAPGEVREPPGAYGSDNPEDAASQGKDSRGD